MAIPEIPEPKLEGVLTCKCGWRGSTAELREIEGYSCPKCGDSLFPPEWLNADNSGEHHDRR